MSACSFSILTLNLVLTHGVPLDVRGGNHIFYHHTPSGQSRLYRVTQLRTGGVHCRESAVGSVPSFSGRVIAYQWRSLLRVRWHRASSPQGSSSNGCRLCITMDQLLLCASLFPHPLLVQSEYVEIIVRVSKYYYCCTDVLLCGPVPPTPPTYACTSVES